MDCQSGAVYLIDVDEVRRGTGLSWVLSRGNVGRFSQRRYEVNARSVREVCWGFAVKADESGFCQRGRKRVKCSVRQCKGEGGLGSLPVPCLLLSQQLHGVESFSSRPVVDCCPLLQVADDGLEAKTVTQATNTNAGCVNGMDPNGNPCVTKQKHDPICKVCMYIWSSAHSRAAPMSACTHQLQGC
jgi:hypothetical protein